MIQSAPINFSVGPISPAVGEPSPSYDVIRGTASHRLFKEIVFSAAGLAAIDWNGDIMRGLGQHMTKCDLWHCIMTFQRSPEVTDLD